MRKILLFLFFSISFQVAFSQNKFKEVKVKKGETLYSIARNYNVSVDKLILHNPGLTKQSKLKLNDLIKIPLLVSTSKVSSTSNNSSSSGNSVVNVSPYPVPQIDTSDDIKVTEKIGKNSIVVRKHIIKPKETLYSLAKYYGLTVDDLRKINPDMDQPKAGYELIVQKEMQHTSTNVSENTVKQASNTGVLKNQVEVLKDEKSAVKLAKESSPKNKSDQNKVLAKESKNVPVNANNSAELNAEVKEVKPLLPIANVKPDEYDEFYKTYEKDGFKISCLRGKASLVSSKETPLEAYYSNAQEGTLIKVKNMLTHQTVVLKVKGKVTDSEIKSGVILKMSKEAAESIGAKEGQLLIEVNSFKYM